jgi:hypothetical protein
MMQRAGRQPMEVCMRVVHGILAIVLSLTLVAPGWAQQQRLVDQGTLDRALAERIESARADRQAILQLLERPDVRRLADRAGLTQEQARVAVGMLDGRQLSEIATQARVADAALAGAGGNIVISATTLIIILLLIILVVLIAR